MQYMLLIYGDPAAAEAAGDPPASAFQEWPEATRALAEDGVLLAGDGLVPDRDTALGWAARMPMVNWGTVEVRAVMESPASASGFLGGATSAA